ncbi:MAG: TolC family protein [Williamsia sp.]|nr:TolC family protein [Williamsia sp.]
MRSLTRWLNKLVNLAGGLLLLLSLPAVSQSLSALSIQQAFDLSALHYPAGRRKELITEAEKLLIRTAATNRLPQLATYAQASYQSDVTRLDLSLPGFKAPLLSKDQYKAYADLSQSIYDGGQFRKQRAVQQTNSAVEQSKLDVELYSLKNRISQLYLGVLYQQELLKQTNLLLNDVRTGISKVKPQVENGTVLRSNLLLLEAQALQTEQRAIEIYHTRKGLLDALAVLLDTTFSDSIKLELPAPAATPTRVLARPELRLYNNQLKLLAAQKGLADIKNRPRLAAFVQAGAGRPALNFLSNSLKGYYIGGLRLNWSLGGLYTVRQDKKLLETNQRAVDLQKQTFVLNTAAQLRQQEAEIRKAEALMASDSKLIQLRKQISDAAKAQLENAVITTNDYLKEINAEDEVRQQLIIHQIQLLQAKINWALVAGTL